MRPIAFIAHGCCLLRLSEAWCMCPGGRGVGWGRETKRLHPLVGRHVLWLLRNSGLRRQHRVVIAIEEWLAYTWQRPCMLSLHALRRAVANVCLNFAAEARDEWPPPQLAARTGSRRQLRWRRARVWATSRDGQSTYNGTGCDKDGSGSPVGHSGCGGNRHLHRLGRRLSCCGRKSGLPVAGQGRRKLFISPPRR